MTRKITIATRRSPLALWQASTVRSLLEQNGLSVELNLVTTSGDKMQRGALASMTLDDEKLPAHLKTGKGLFVKEVQEELMAGRADLAVHSMKDLPVETTSGLRLSAVLPRANPADVMIFSPRLLSELNADQLFSSALDVHFSVVISKLQQRDWTNAAPIGTTSARRQFFLRKEFASSTLPLVILRGNVDSRLSRVQNNEFSFILLARAGLDRLKVFNPNHMLTIPLSLSTPAPAQGVVGIECRENDFELRALLSKLNHPRSACEAACERLALWMTGGDCHSAFAAHLHNNQLKVWAAKEHLYKELRMDFSNAEIDQITMFSNSEDYQQTFEWLRSGSVGQSLYAQLLQAGFQQMMDLKDPKNALTKE